MWTPTARHVEGNGVKRLDIKEGRRAGNGNGGGDILSDYPTPQLVEAGESVICIEEMTVFRIPYP